MWCQTKKEKKMISFISWSKRFHELWVFLYIKIKLNYLHILHPLVGFKMCCLYPPCGALTPPWKGLFYIGCKMASVIDVGIILWHINHCSLFNAKSSLYIYIKYIWFGLVGFYGISTIVGYLMPNLLYTYILNIYDLVWLGFMAYQPL